MDKMNGIICMKKYSSNYMHDLFRFSIYYGLMTSCFGLLFKRPKLFFMVGAGIGIVHISKIYSQHFNECKSNVNLKVPISIELDRIEGFVKSKGKNIFDIIYKNFKKS